MIALYLLAYLTVLALFVASEPFIPYYSRNLPFNAVTGYIGCFVDDGSRDMGSMVTRNVPSLASARFICAGKLYFALQIGERQLYCSDSFGTASKYMMVNDSECTYNNPATDGAWRNAVFYTIIPTAYVPFTPYSSRNLPISDISTGYLGCFVDDYYRDMGQNPGQYGYVVSTGRTYCKTLGYLYFALQDNGWLTCSNVFGRTSTYTKQQDDTECGTNRLGGTYRNAVYLTDYAGILG